MPRYLLVDDSRAIRVTLADLLRKFHPAATFTEAANGEEALVAFNDGRFDVIFLDLIMPGPVDGLTVLRKILELDPRTRVAVVTGLPDHAPEVVSALSEGACAYMRKPVSHEGVRHVLDRIARSTGQAGTIR